MNFKKRLKNLELLQALMVLGTTRTAQQVDQMEKIVAKLDKHYGIDHTQSPVQSNIEVVLADKQFTPANLSTIMLSLETLGNQELSFILERIATILAQRDNEDDAKLSAAEISQETMQG